jgi:hypothetical protein
MMIHQEVWQPLQRQLEQQQLELEDLKKTREIEEKKKKFARGAQAAPNNQPPKANGKAPAGKTKAK